MGHKRIEPSEAEFASLVEEVLEHLARDPAAAHLWQWRARPGCADEPPGRSRRNHLASLLGLLGAAALPGAAAGCDSSTSNTDAAACGDDPCAVDAGPTSDKSGGGDAPQVKDGATTKDGNPPGKDAKPCADDPCSCADDPCACGDDPCACADDPCACGDDPCGGCGDDPCAVDMGADSVFKKKDFKFCADDPCYCADDPCAGGP
jgi:hypothetical protein